MINKWSEFNSINENLQKARRVLRESNIPETNPNFLKLRALLVRKAGYLGKFTEWMFKNKMSYEQLENLFNRIKDINLSKQIDEYKSPEEIIDSLIRTDSAAAVNQMINSIPSRTREFLKTETNDYEEEYEDEDEEYKTCEKCDGDGTIECKTCDGNGYIDCKICNGTKDINCKACGGSGKIENGEECEECDGDGEIECEECDSSGQIECKECDVSGEIECKECEGEGSIPISISTKVETNEEGSENWNKLISFLTLKYKDKDIISSFLSKKGARYGSDYDPGDYGDGDFGTNCERLIYDIDKLLNTKSIDDVKNISLKDNDIKFVFDNKDYLIVAVNYEGIKKIGSSYWCIVGDRGTFDDYVTNSKRLQLVLFDRNKLPFIDDESVMGITLDYQKNIRAAHWEDDDECMSDANSIIKSIDIPESKLIDILCHFYNSSDLTFLLYVKSELYIPLIQNALDHPKRLEKIIIDLLDHRDEYGDYDDDYDEDDEDYKTKYKFDGFINYFIKCLTENDIKVNLPDLNDVLGLDIIDVSKFYKNWLDVDIFEYIDDNFNINDPSKKDKISKILKVFNDKEYDFNKNISSSNFIYYIPLLKDIGIFNVSKFYKRIAWGNASHKNLITVIDDVVKWIVDNDFNYISNNEHLLRIAVSYIDKNNIVKCIDKLPAIFNKVSGNGTFKNTLEYIMENSENEDISKAAALSLIPKGLLSRFNISFTKKEKVEAPKSIKAPKKKK